MFLASHKKPIQLNPISTRSRVSSKEQIQRALKFKKHPFNPELSSKTHLSLFLNYSEADLDLHIPPTLLLLNSINKQILFYHKAGELHMEEGSSTTSKFIDLAKDQEVHKYRQPKFISFNETGISLLNDEEDLKPLFRTDCQTCIQKFIASDKKNSTKLRIFWNRDKGFTYWTVNNKNSLPKTQWFQEESIKKVQSSYMFKVNEFHYAGRLLKTSMSPFNLYSSKIKKIKSQREIIKHNELFIRRNSHVKSTYPLNLYLAKQSDPENSSSYKLLLNYPKLEFFISSIVAAVDKWVENLGTRDVKKASFDFVEDRKGKWFFIGCKFQDIDFESHLQSLNMTKARINGKMQMQELRLEEGNEQKEKYSQKITDLKNRVFSISVRSARYIDLDKSSMIALYRPMNKDSHFSEWHTTKNDSEISPIASLYDTTINKARELKKKTQQYSEVFNEYLKKGHKIPEIIEEIIDSMSLNDNFSPYTRLFTKVLNFKEFLDNSLRGLVSNIKTGNNQILKDLGVTRRNFEEFIMILNSVLLKHYEEDIKEIILENIIESSGFT